MRALTVVFFLATGVVMFAIGKRLGGNARWWMLALCLTQPLLFRYAFEVRAYSLLALLTATTVLSFIIGNRIALALSATALLYTHLFGVWVVGVLIAWALLNRGPVVPLLVAVALNAPWALNYLSFGRAAMGWWLPPPTAESAALYLTKLGAPLLLAVIPLARRVAMHRYFTLSALLWLVPIVGALIVSIVKPIFLDRYLIVVVPAQVMLLALASGARSYRVIATSVLVAQVAVCAYVFVHPAKPPFRDLAAYVESLRRPGDAVINMDPLTYFESHYYGLDSRILSATPDLPIYMGSVLIPPGDIIATLPPDAGRYFWIEIHDLPEDRHPLPLPLVESRDFGKVTVSLYLSR
jgi:hypothetical protein